MKNKILVIPIVGLSIFILSGCVDKTNDAVKYSNLALDKKIFDEAVSELSSTRCKQIETKEVAEECEKSVAGLLISKEAASKIDDSLCDDIALERYKENCVIEVQAARDKKELKEKAEEIKQQEEKLYAEIYEDLDLERCDEFEGGMRLTCQANIIITLAAKNSDKGICQKLENKSLIEACEEGAVGAKL